MTNRMSWGLAALAFVVVAASAAGCLSRDLAPVDPSTQSGVFVEISQTGTTKVDILFVVDNSNSMYEEQEVLTDQILVMAQELIDPSPPDSGQPPPAVEDMHIGIVTSDVGTGGYQVTTCENQVQGDNGELQNIGRLPGCQPSYSAADCTRAECPWLVHSAAFPDNDPANAPIWDDFGCIATLGTGGCGFEQQLESSLIAVTTQAEPGRRNEGFLRSDSLIAIIYVTDEDDCSTPEAEMFNITNDTLPHLNIRCALREDLLYPVTRYYEAFVGLRPGNEDLVVVAAITGVPVDGSWNPGDSIDELRALRVVDPARPDRLLPSCSTGMGEAFPPVRIAELVYMFGNNGILESICRSDWTQALQAITRKIQSKLTGACMSRQLASTDSDVCRVIETLIDDRECPHLANDAGGGRTSGWHVDLGLDEDGHRQCEILPADYDGDGCPDGVGGGGCSCDEPYGGCLAGWFYVSQDDNCPDGGGQVKFTSPEVTSDLSDVRFECRTALCPQRQQCDGAAGEGAPCNPVANDCGGGQVCVRHNDPAICGGSGTCGRCSDTVGNVCPAFSDIEEVRLEPLVEAGSCCHDGFHCEGGRSCLPNRTTACD